MPYKFYTVEAIPCPNCTPCDRHEYARPRLHVGRRYFVKNDDGTETQLTEEEYKSWDESSSRRTPKPA